mgnify:CR=1 FL=1
MLNEESHQESRWGQFMRRSSASGKIDSLFAISSRGSSVSTELMGGLFKSVQLNILNK